jgi:hypothetical protein
MSIQDQYASTVRQTQEAWAGIVESLTDNAQALTKSGNPVPTIDPTAAIDQVFDFWSKTLDAQREVLKQLAGASVAVGEQVRSHAEQVGSAVREQGENAKTAVREQTEAAKRAERQQERAQRDQAAAKYDDLSKSELQDELANRGLVKSGNVDELRSRLVADDLK